MEEYRVLVTGSRDWSDYLSILKALQKIDSEQRGKKITLVSGACPTGADAMAESIAEDFGWSVERHPADWAAHGKFAGPKRNREMVESHPDICLAFPRGKSLGTRGCLKYAKLAGIETRILEG
jgi:hypothetical protein